MISRSMNVRETARKVGVQVCECLGPRYLPVIIKEMKLIMKKGFQVRVRAEWKTTSFRARCNWRVDVFQVHVMIYTVHTFISAMRDRLKTGDLDACLEDVLDVSDHVTSQGGNLWAICHDSTSEVYQTSQRVRTESVTLLSESSVRIASTGSIDPITLKIWSSALAGHKRRTSTVDLQGAQDSWRRYLLCCHAPALTRACL